MKKNAQHNQLQIPFTPGSDEALMAKPAYKRIKTEKLPTNNTTSKHSIHRWFNFVAGFSPEFVDSVCRDSLAARPPHLLLDPFAGCGTAPLEALKLGMGAIGYEAHPFFERISQAKLSGTALKNGANDIFEIVAEGLQQPADLDLLEDPQRIFLEKLFSEDVLAQLLGARENLKKKSLHEDPLAFLILSKVVEKSSHSATDGIYKAPTSLKRACSPITALSDICDMVRMDGETFSPSGRLGKAHIIGKSSESMLEIQDKTVSIVVTSPPYLNNFDYAEMTRMHLYFWGMASSWGEITDKIRSRLIVNTTTALKGHKQLQQSYREEITPAIHSEIDGIVSALRLCRSQKAGKKEYDLLVYPYFAQMTRVLRECFRVMREGAPIHIMVADAALYGVHIKAPQLLTQILHEIGFCNLKCDLVRHRGHRWILEKREGAAAGLGEYHVYGWR